MTETEWLEVAAEIHDAWRQNPTDGWVSVWYGVLAEFPVDVVRAAVGQYAAGPRAAFMPNGGELAAIARELTGQGTPDFDEIWAEVQRQVQRVGSWGKPELSAHGASVVEFLGGWRTVCAMESDQLGTARAQARKAYDDIAQRAERTAARDRMRLTGISTAGELKAAEQLLGESRQARRARERKSA